MSSAEVYGHAEIKNIGSAEVYARAEIGQNSEVLYGHGIIRNIASAEVYGHAVIIHSIDLYSYAEIKNIASSDLKFQFRVSTDAWIIQGVSVEAYITKTIVI